MCDNNKRKRKRTELECLSCGSSFDHDFRRKHEIKMHGGNRVKVKDISLGKADNPFSAAQLNFQRKAQSKQANSSVSLTVSSDVEEQNDLEIVSGNALDLKHSDQSILPVSLIMSPDVPDMSLVPTTDNTWVNCVGKYSALLCMLNECNNLLTKVTNDSIPNPNYIFFN